MSRTSTYLRAALVTGAALVMTAAVAAPASAQTLQQRFAATYQDECVSADTRGTLGWPDPTGSGLVRGVEVQGVVNEANACEQSNRRVYAEFTAYVGDRAVDRELAYATEWSTARGYDFRFVLSNEDGVAPIDRVDVRVCRNFGPWLPAFQCGDTETYYGPGTPTIGPPIPTVAAG